MTYKEIQKELNKIYRERKSWNGAKGPFDKGSILKRELILIKQNVLYDMQAAIKKNQLFGDREKEFSKILSIINQYLNL